MSQQQQQPKSVPPQPTAGRINQPSQPVVASNHDDVVAMAGEIYVAWITSSMTHARTHEHLAREAFVAAREFIAEASRQTELPARINKAS